MNVLDVMLDITKIIFDKSSKRWEKIRPEYFAGSSRLAFLKEEPLLKESLPDDNTMMQVESTKDFGTITEYVLLSL